MVSTVESAKEQALKLIHEDISRYTLPISIDPKSPDGDPGKFLLQGKVARVIHRRDGFYAKINLDWFDGDLSEPDVNGTNFYWYVFALDPKKGNEASTYYICDYRKMVDFVLDFKAPLGNDHRNHSTWNGAIHVIDEAQEKGYFYWRDEGPEYNKVHRFIPLRNIIGVLESQDLLYSRESEFVDIIAERPSYYGLKETERQAIIKSRIGQGIFRDELVDFWGSCSVTGVELIDILIASHIKPWRFSTNQERLDVYNGLLLQPTLDSLFDKGLISFSDNGEMLFSSILSQSTIEKLGLEHDMKLTIVHNEHIPYLTYHRKEIFQQ